MKQLDLFDFPFHAIVVFRHGQKSHIIPFDYKDKYLWKTASTGKPNFHPEFWGALIAEVDDKWRDIAYVQICEREVGKVSLVCTLYPSE